LQYSEEFKTRIDDTTRRGSSLVQDIQFPKNKESLLDVIQNIWSAARIEGSDEIAHFAELVQKVVKSTLTGSIPLSTNVRNILAESFKELKRSSQDGSAVNQKHIQDLKLLLDNIKREEKDYIIIKKLKVLYIDEDTFSHYKVKRNSDKYIEIEPCFSTQDALQKLDLGKYDVILCDFKPTDPVIGEVFHLYSSRVPIVAMSASDSLKETQTATRLGAMDFIIKNDEGMKSISRSLHTAAYEWQKRIRQKKRKMIDPQAKKILKHLLNNGGHMRQALDSHIEIISDSGHTVREMEDTDHNDLDNLVALNYLSKDPAE
jgi:CheY-like chemotaxis protein